MDYVEPQPTYQYENHSAYSAASKKAVEGFSKFINPFDSPEQDKPLFSKENALRVATNIATRGQGDVLKSSVNSVFDAGVSVKEHLSQAKVVAVNNQELGEPEPSDRDQLAALNDVSKELNKKGNEENKKRFDQSLSSAESCLDNNGYVDVKDPSTNLNQEVDGKYFTDVKIACWDMFSVACDFVFADLPSTLIKLNYQYFIEEDKNKKIEIIDLITKHTKHNRNFITFFNFFAPYLNVNNYAFWLGKLFENQYE